jgi:hypothetical protein
VDPYRIPRPLPIARNTARTRHRAIRQSLKGASGGARHSASRSEEAGRNSCFWARNCPLAGECEHEGQETRYFEKARRRAERSHQKLAEHFLARLYRSWQQHGSEVLDRAMAERPQLYFRALVRLTMVCTVSSPSPRDFRRHYRAANAAARGEQGLRLSMTN